VSKKSKRVDMEFNPTTDELMLLAKAILVEKCGAKQSVQEDLEHYVNDNKLSIPEALGMSLISEFIEHALESLIKEHQLEDKK
jgi:hypothetical protein